MTLEQFCKAGCPECVKDNPCIGTLHYVGLEDDIIECTALSPEAAFEKLWTVYDHARFATGAPTAFMPGHLRGNVAGMIGQDELSLYGKPFVEEFHKLCRACNNIAELVEHIGPRITPPDAEGQG